MFLIIPSKPLDLLDCDALLLNSFLVKSNDPSSKGDSIGPNRSSFPFDCFRYAQLFPMTFIARSAVCCPQIL